MKSSGLHILFPSLVGLEIFVLHHCKFDWKLQKRIVIIIAFAPLKDQDVSTHLLCCISCSQQAPRTHNSYYHVHSCTTFCSNAETQASFRIDVHPFHIPQLSRETKLSFFYLNITFRQMRVNLEVFPQKQQYWQYCAYCSGKHGLRHNVHVCRAF